jgi:AcrR family transcriptional regulator
MMATLDDPLPRRGYHVGNVRSGLLDHALLILESEGIEHLNLRGLATSAGVSIGTIYYHFSSKAALLAQLSAHGFWELRAELRKVVAAKRRIRRCALTFYEFSRSRPALYALMFDPAMNHSERVRHNRDAAFREFETIIARAAEGDGVSDALVHSVARAVWACSHGVAALSIAEDSEQNLMEEVIQGLGTLFAALPPMEQKPRRRDVMTQDRRSGAASRTNGKGRRP